jgi:drug/metabolite transporter (DMT)-like permease
MMSGLSSAEPRGLIGNALALSSAVAFALANVSAITAFHAGSNPLTLAAARFVLPALVVVAWLAVQHRRVWLPRRDGFIAVGLGVLTAGLTGSLLSAIGAIPLGLAILIYYLFPLVATVILAVFGWERLGWRTIAAIVVALLGLALALDPRVGGLNVKGVLLAFAAALGLGIVVAVSSRVFRSGDSRPLTLYMATVAAVLLIAFCALHGDFAWPSTANGWVGFAAASLFYAFAMIAFFIAVATIGPVRSSLLCYADPVVSAGLGVAFLGETLTSTQIAGIALVIGALVWATLVKQSQTPSQP